MYSDYHHPPLYPPPKPEPTPEVYMTYAEHPQVPYSRLVVPCYPLLTETSPLPGGLQDRINRRGYRPYTQLCWPTLYG
jgi:hypothetical protein